MKQSKTLQNAGIIPKLNDWRLYERKEARIIYDKGDPTKKGTVAEEGFYLEVLDKEHGWCIVSKAPCRKSLDFPDEKEKDFIHWDILKTICQLSEQGYTIRLNPENQTEEK